MRLGWNLRYQNSRKFHRYPFLFVGTEHGPCHYDPVADRRDLRPKAKELEGSLLIDRQLVSDLASRA